MPSLATRLLWLVSQKAMDLDQMCQALAREPGPVFQALHQLEAEGLVATDPVRAISRLTPAGKTRVQASIIIIDADPLAPEATACLAAYYRVLTDTIPALDPHLLTLPLPDAAQYRAPRGAFLLAMSDGMALGCISFRPLGRDKPPDAAADQAEAKRLWVHPDARGLGLARRLMAAIADRARAMGYSQMKLDSNSALDNAVGLYRRMGWMDCPAYTGFPADIWMSKSL